MQDFCDDPVIPVDDCRICKVGQSVDENPPACRHSLIRPQPEKGTHSRIRGKDAFRTLGHRSGVVGFGFRAQNAQQDQKPLGGLTKTAALWICPQLDIDGLP